MPFPASLSPSEATVLLSVGGDRTSATLFFLPFLSTHLRCSVSPFRMTVTACSSFCGLLLLGSICCRLKWVVAWVKKIAGGKKRPLPHYWFCHCRVTCSWAVLTQNKWAKSCCQVRVGEEWLLQSQLHCPHLSQTPTSNHAFHSSLHPLLSLLFILWLQPSSDPLQLRQQNSVLPKQLRSLQLAVMVRH